MPVRRLSCTRAASRGVHTEHLGFILAEMQFLQRAYPGRDLVERDDTADPSVDQRSGTGWPRCRTRKFRSFRLTDLGIIRDVAWDGDTLVVTVTPTYSGCPATAVINLDIETALAAKGLREAAARTAAFAALDHRLDQRRGPRKAARLWNCPADRRHRRRTGVLVRRIARLAGRSNLAVACPRCGSAQYRKYQPVRLDPLQGELSLPRLPGAVRLFQVHLSAPARTCPAWHVSIR